MDGSMTDRAIDHDVAMREKAAADWEAKLEAAYGVFWMFHAKAIRDALAPLKMSDAWIEDHMESLCDAFAEKEASSGS